MLKDLSYTSFEPSGIFAVIASVNGTDLSNQDSYFEHLAEGVYRHDGYKFNFDGFIDEKCANNIVDEWVAYGVCDNHEQVLEKYAELLKNRDKNYVIGLSTVKKADQEPVGGWRWHKWGQYIGTHVPQCEYLYDEEGIEQVYCYHIYQID